MSRGLLNNLMMMQGKVMVQEKVILVVDSDADSNGLLAAKLDKDGYQVETVQRVGDILEKVLTSQVSLIVMNLQVIPDCEVIPMIRKINKNIPIITVTDDDSIEMEKRVRQEGVFFYFVKPFTIEDMKTAIKSAIGTGN